MSLLRRQKSLPIPNGEQQLDIDAECPAHDVIKLTPPSTPSSPYLQRSRSRELVPSVMPLCLRHVWQCISRAPASDAGTSTACFASSEPGHAPVSASGVRSSERRQQGRGSCTNLMVVVSRISLVAVVGALLFDVYLLKKAYTGAMGRPSTSSGISDRSSSARRKQRARLNNNRKDTDAADHSTTRYSRPRFHWLPPGNDNGQASDSSAESLRPIWDRVAEIEKEPFLAEDGTPETGTERGSPSKRGFPSSRNKTKGTKISRLAQNNKGRASAMHGAHLLESTATAARPDKLVSDPILMTAPVPPPPPPRPDPYGGQRVAVVVPYVGRDLPAWWDVFAEQARLNDGLVDWIIFCDKASFV